MIGTRESRLIQYHARELVSIGWDINTALSAAANIVYAEQFKEQDHPRNAEGEFAETKEAPETVRPNPNIRRKWRYYANRLSTHGHQIAGHPRIAFQKSVFTPEQLEQLGFRKSVIAVPESGQDALMSWRHPDNHHLHSHGEHWVLHRDHHPSLTMALAEAKGPKEKATAIKDGLAHIFGEGAPGLGRYLLNRVRHKRTMAEALAEAKREERRNKKKGK